MLALLFFFLPFKDRAAVLGRPLRQQREPRCCTSCIVNPSFGISIHIIYFWFGVIWCDTPDPLFAPPLSLCVSVRSSMLQLHSNPGDYAWGQGGLDAVITEVSDVRVVRLKNCSYIIDRDILYLDPPTSFFVFIPKNSRYKVFKCCLSLSPRPFTISSTLSIPPRALPVVRTAGEHRSTSCWKGDDLVPAVSLRLPGADRWESQHHCTLRRVIRTIQFIWGENLRCGYFTLWSDCFLYLSPSASYLYFSNNSFPSFIFPLSLLI